MHNYGHWKKTLALLVMSALSLGASSVDAMPEGGVVRSGSGSVTQNGKEMTIRQDSGRLAMDWTGFSVGKDETVRFQQPGKDALALNRVTGNQQSVIDGSLLSNGHVLLVNPNGVVIGKNASIDVGGLVASTAQVKDNFMKEFGNSTGAFSLGGVSDGKIINEGTIKAEGGLVALHAAKVENSGTISNTGGSAVLAAADTLTLTPDADGKLNFTVDGKAAEASALNKGTITADGGTIVMTADSASDVMSTVVNNSGTLQARTLRKNEKGQILLEGGDKGQVEVSGTLDASGTEEGQSAGNIKVIGEKTIVHDGTNLLARGNVNGGKIETSGDVLNLGDNLNIDAKGVSGKAGEWLLDPLDVYICDNDPTTTYDSKETDIKKYETDGSLTRSTSIGYNDPAATNANASSVNSAVTWISTAMVENMLNAGTSVTIQAAATNGNANIIVSSNIDKTLGNDATLTLDAMRNITVNGNISSTSNKLNVILNADSNGDQIGAVIINANINTNGGDFTSASGGTVTYESDEAKTKGYDKGTLSGDPDHKGHTVGTYFGHVDSSGTADGTKDDRLIKTGGGNITLNGEIAIGLNGGTLTLDSGGGAVTATGIINSGNSYGAYVYGTDTWNTLVEQTVASYLKEGKVPAYHYQGVNYVKNPDGSYATNDDGSYKTTTDAADFPNGDPHYTFDKETNTQNIRWLGDGSSTAVSITKGKGYSSVIITEGKMSTKEYLQYVAVSDPAGFLSRYMTSNPTITVESKSYALTVGSVTVNRVSNNALGYKVGNKFTALTQQQIQSLAEGALTLAKNSTDTTAMSNDLTAYTNLTNDIKRLIASNWFVSETLAKYDPKTKTYNNGKSAVEDSYLATITTVLENSLTTPNGQQILWAGGRGSGVLNKKGSTSSANDKLYPYSYYGMPDDPTYQDGMYWVTGPEGAANNGKGTQFYSNVGSDWGTVSLGSDGKTYTYNQGNNVYGYVNWDTWTDKATATDTKRVDVTRSQPDNSSPFLSVGYGTTGEWDDAAMGGATTVGFIKETNLANSSLNIKAGSGEVKLQGDIGKSKALDTVSIESTKAVTVGTDNNNVTDYYHGTIYVDHGLYISGNGVKVGGEIHSGESEETDTSTTLEDTYKDNVTILSSGDIEVHGITSNTYDAANKDGTTTTRGGKISLTSTGTEGVITLGDGVDYNGKNTNGGVLKAASTANDAVVIDAQGEKSKFVNETTSTKAIDTQGKWKIYSASPEQNTFGKNLNSETDAQWTSDSTKFAANGSDKNKFIFQATPVITLHTDNYLKTYGDEVSPDTLNNLLKGKEAFFTGLDGKSHNVNEYSSAFQEEVYTKYISGADTVKVTSDGSTATATRTGGKYEATDKSGADHKNAVYDLTVNLNDAKALDGYAIDTENGKLEIKKRTASITGTGTQTYGDTDGTIKNWTDTQTNIADGSTVYYTTSIKSDSDYTKNQDGRKTADHGTYNDSVSFDGLKITDSKGNDVSIADNYDLTTTGTIDVAKAKLTVNTDGKTTTYGTVDESYTSKLDDSTKALNGDDAKKLISDLELTYKTDAYQDDDGNGTYDRTNHVKYTSDGKDYDSYTLDVDHTKELKNYDVTVNDSTVTLKRAQATVDTDNVTTTYGTVDKNYTSQFNKAVNGDNGDELLKQLKLSYSTDAYTDDTHTNNVKDGGYDLNVQANGSLTYHDYDVKVNDSNVTLNKVNLTVNPEDIHRIYGQATEVQEDAKTAYNLSGFANGDTKDTTDKEGKTIDQLVTVTNDVSKALKDDTHTQNASTDGYDIKTTASGDLTNYNIVIGDSKKVYLDKAELVIDTDSNSKVYGDWQGVKSDVEGAAHIRDAETAVVNGDKVSDLEKEMGLTTSSEALIKNADGTYKTNHVKDGGYAIDTKFADAITNYTVKRGAAGTEILTKAQATVDTDNVTTTYGTVNKNYTSHFNTAVNGDNGDELLKQLKLSYSTDAYDKDGKPTNDVKEGGYDLLVTANGSLDHDDYDVTVKNANVTLNKAKLVIDTDSNSKVYGDWQGVKSDVEGAAHIRDAATSVVNGDDPTKLVEEMGLKTSSEALLQNADGTYKTNHVKDGGYDIKTEFLDTIKNYDVSRGTDGVETLTKAKAVVDTDKVTTTYGTVDKNYTSHFNTAVNGDDANELLKQLELSYSTDAYDKDGKPTNDVKEGGYDLLVTANGSLDHDDYDVTVKNANVTLNKAKLVIDTDSNSKVYGDWQGVKSDVEGAAHIRDAATSVVNGDDPTKLVEEMGLKTSSEALLQNADGTYKTNHVKDGGYDIKTEFLDTIKNYDVSRGTDGVETLTKAKAVVDTDKVTTTYGTVDKNYTSYFKGEVNGDDPAKLLEDLKLTYKTEAYKDDTHTNDVKDGGYTLEVAKTADLGDYNVMVNNSNVILNPKTITIRNTMTQQYGSTEKIFSEATVPADQLANGDTISTKDLKFDIKADGDYAKSLAENKKKNSGAVTADAGTYTGDLIHTGGGIIHKDGTDAYKNYKVTVEGDIIVTPKDIYTWVIGKGSTLNDLIWTIKINPKDQMVNGDSVEFTYTPGNLISYDNQTFDVNSFIDEKPISDGTQIGNYIYHPKGIVQLTFNPIVKPDVWAHSGGYRPRNKIETSLPVFRVEDTKVGQYGTYGVEHNEEGDKLVLSATGMRLPEPDQVPDEERTFTTTLSTETGSGTFKLVYNGVSLKVYPQDKEAEETVRAGDKTKNVSLSEKALYVGYTEMGLDLIDLKGVYIYFN